MTIVILFLGFFIFIILGIPIGIAIGIASIIALLTGDLNVSMTIFPQRMFVASDNFILMAIPFFMLVGEIMERSGITQRIVNFANSSLGWLRFGMCYVTIMAGMIMGGISGSCTADTAALSAVMIPTMNKLGYKKGFTAAVMASSGTIGIIIPPSIPMIILGSITGISISRLFIGGIIPGIIIGLSLMITSRFVCIKYKMGFSDFQKFSIKNLIKSFYETLPPLLAPVIIIGGILSGIFTATESSAIALIYVSILGVFVYKTIKSNMLIDIFAHAAKNTAIVMFVIGSSTLFSWILTINNFSIMLAEGMLSISHNPFIILFFINLIFFIGGMFIDGTPMIIMFVPLFLPIITAANINHLLFGLMICMNVAIGAITPPVCAALYVAASVGNVKFSEAGKSVFPFVIAIIICLLIVVLVPETVTFLPRVMVK